MESSGRLRGSREDRGFKSQPPFTLAGFESSLKGPGEERKAPSQPALHGFELTLTNVKMANCVSNRPAAGFS